MTDGSGVTTRSMTGMNADRLGEKNARAVGFFF